MVYVEEECQCVEIAPVLVVGLGRSDDVVPDCRSASSNGVHVDCRPDGRRDRGGDNIGGSCHE